MFRYRGKPMKTWYVTCPMTTRRVSYTQNSRNSVGPAPHAAAIETNPTSKPCLDNMEMSLIFDLIDRALFDLEVVLRLLMLAQHGFPLVDQPFGLRSRQNDNFPRPQDWYLMSRSLYSS